VERSAFGAFGRGVLEVLLALILMMAFNRAFGAILTTVGIIVPAAVDSSLHAIRTLCSRVLSSVRTPPISGV
jgi:hypothetical protein